jgi:hypothetical protein
MLSKRFYGAALMAAIVIPVTLEGCSSDSPLCCTEFKAGATVDAKIGGSAQAQVAVQAVADFSGIASAAIDDLTTACRSMSQDLDADKTKQDAAEANTDKQARMKAWCALAVEAIGTVKGQAQATISVKAPSCQASVSAKANCQAKCSGGAKCDLKANPPQCTGGKLEVSCKGDCTASAGASVSCEGECSGNCEGSCSAEGGVECSGKCEGKCEAGGSAGGNGIQADGTCKGVCKGTCSVTPPGVKCSGSCNGKCSATCKGSATAAVKCDGTCAVDAEPLKCEGGKLEGGCKADVKCDGNCDASVKAKAECTPPSIGFSFSGDAQAAGKLKATLEANLGVVMAFKSRLEGMVEVAGTISGSASAVGDIKAACIPQVVAAGAAAVTDVTAAASATASIATSVGAS